MSDLVTVLCMKYKVVRVWGLALLKSFQDSDKPERYKMSLYCNKKKQKPHGVNDNITKADKPGKYKTYLYCKKRKNRVTSEN